VKPKSHDLLARKDIVRDRPDSLVALAGFHGGAGQFAGTAHVVWQLGGDWLGADALLLAGSCSGGCGKSPWHTHEGELLDDDVLQQRVQAALQRHGKQFKDVRAQVTDGALVLSGNVISDDLRARSEEISLGVHGIKKVDDQIRTISGGNAK
jgi:hypothetical protein